ncbi:MAG: alcohol dehydrogenase catalytic domain-containing protein [Rubrivivax sp.]|jgi:alcohol dehydrogenase/propanol-preferring alcohol dehydrogenase|nr:alcohol dehydrogenase catalytic domain-containing protein [Rubrivivax sp.]
MLSYQVEAYGRPLAEVLRDTPAPQGTEVLLRVHCCGVCHSDVHLQDGWFDLGGGQRIDMTRAMQLPRTLGHEIAGTVVAVGPDAHGVQVGDRRVVFPWIGCGSCAVCQRGHEHLCGAPRALGANRDGGYADHVLVPHPRVLVDPGELPLEQACTYACAGLTAYSAMKKLAPLSAGDAVLVIGGGGLGLAGVRLARQLYGVAAIVAEIDRAKWDLAREAGAADVIDPTAEGAAKALLKATGGVAAAVDFVGSGSSFTFGFGALRKAGRLVCVGLIGGSATVVPLMVSMKAVSITGSYVGSLAELQELMAIGRSGVLPPMPLVPRPLADANAVLDELRAGRIRGRAVLLA